MQILYIYILLIYLSDAILRGRGGGVVDVMMLNNNNNNKIFDNKTMEEVLQYIRLMHLVPIHIFILVKQQMFMVKTSNFMCPYIYIYIYIYILLLGFKANVGVYLICI